MATTTMTKREALAQIRRLPEDAKNVTDAQADAWFVAIYKRQPDARDRRDGVFSLCCAAL